MRSLHAEWVKLWTLPAAWVASVLAVALPVGLAALNARFLHRVLDSGQTGGLLTTSTVDEGFGQLTFGLIGVVVLGVVSISSEYTRNARTVGAGRQVSTTMVAAPRRGLLMTKKLVVLSLWVAALGAVTVPLTLWVSTTLLGEHATALDESALRRGLWAGAYWVAVALLAFALAALTRNGIIPLVLLISNVSVVSFSLLAAQVTTWARYLPDLAAYPTFMTSHPMDDPLSPAAGAAVLAGWCAVGVTAALTSYTRRDA